MNIQFELTVIIGIFAAFILLGIGFIIGRLSKQENYLVAEDKLREIEKKRDQIMNQNLGKEIWNPNHRVKEEDFAQPGIVYRPNAEELEKMREPQKVREAKEAVAETIRNTPLPEDI